MSKTNTREDVSARSVWNSRIYGHKRQVTVTRLHGFRVEGLINGSKHHTWDISSFLKSYFKVS